MDICLVGEDPNANTNLLVYSSEYCSNANYEEKNNNSGNPATYVTLDTPFKN